MEQRTNSPYPRIDRPVLAIVGVLLIALVRAVLRERPRARLALLPGRVPQQVAAEVRRRQGARPCRRGVQQIWVARPAARRPLHHLPPGDGLEGLRERRGAVPHAPGRAAEDAPVEKFGCTSCHGGQGWAVDTADAHGEVAHWEEPLLSRVARRGLLAGRRQGRADPDELQRLPSLRPRDEGRRRDQPRQAAGRGEGLPRLPHHQRPRRHIGPDLTRVGEKAPEQYDFTRLSGQRTAFAWHVAHFKDPRALVDRHGDAELQLHAPSRRRRSRC